MPPVDKDDGAQRLRRAAYRLLSIRSRSVREFRERLQRKGFANGPISELIREFQEKGYLNDREFAREWAFHMVDRKVYGGIRVRGELRKKGVPIRIVEEVLKELEIEKGERARARKALERHLKGTPLSASPRAVQERAARYLKRQGFSWEVIADLLGGREALE